MDVQYFIDKFEAIPEEKWCQNLFSDEKGRYCANGHCGVKVIAFVGIPIRVVLTDESKALYEVMIKNPVTPTDYGISLGYGNQVDSRSYSYTAAMINNGDCIEYQQPTPKQRILAALRDIQSKQEQEKAVEETKALIESSEKRCVLCGKPITRCSCRIKSTEQENKLLIKPELETCL